MSEEPTRCWIATGRGVYLTAYAVVFASHIDAAIDAAILFFRDEGLHENYRENVTVREIPLSGAYMVFNGDY